MPHRLGLDLVVRACRGLEFPARSLEVWRFVRAHRDPFDPTGSRLRPARRHNCATTGALYSSLGYATALAEYQVGKSDPFPARAAQFHVDIRYLFDLTDRAVSGRLPFPLERCLQDTVISRRRGAVVGDAAVSLGAGALLAPCLRGPAACLCLYTIRADDYTIHSVRHYHVPHAAAPPEPFSP